MPSQDLHIAGIALCAERSEPRDLVATLRSRNHCEAAEGAHQVKRLALASLPRILAEPDANPIAVMCGGVEQQSLYITRIGPPTHHIEQPIAAVPITAELDANRPIGVVELGLFGGREIPITDDIEIRGSRVDGGTPLALEIEPGRWPDL